MGELSVMVGSGTSKKIRDCFPEGTVLTPGDTKIMWDASKPVEVSAAKSTFDKLIAAGYMAFRAEGSDGHQGSKLTQWEATAERIIMVPKIMGGWQ